MEITYNVKNVKPYDYKPFLTRNQSKNAPHVKINDLGYQYYTLIMYDPDAVHGTYWHWVVTNIVNNINKANVVLNYTGPNPPDEKQHRYIFELYGSNVKTPNVSFNKRNMTLEEGKHILGLQGNPICMYVFISEREKNYGGVNKNTNRNRNNKNRNKNTKKRSHTNKKRKYTKYTKYTKTKKAKEKMIRI